MKNSILLSLILSVFILNIAAQNSISYQYDNLNRLTAVVYSDGSSISYTYNALGDRLSKTVTAVVCAQLPAITTSTVMQIGLTTATCGGIVTSDGGASVTARGVCWSTSHNPTTSNTHLQNGSGLGVFTSSITGLTPNTTYYVRAYATNSVGTVYGNEVSFTTSCGNVNVAISGSSTVNYGQSVTLTAFGASNYSWNTGQNGASITVAPTTTTTYSVTGTDANGCSGTVSKTVTVLPQPPAVATTHVTQVDNTTTTCGGVVTSDGGATVTDRGVCWSTSHNPTTSNTHLQNGSGLGVFTSSITGLTPNTTYYVRAYATNSVGTVYGNEVSFTTSCGNVNVAISGSSTVNYGQSVTLTAFGASNYSWNTGQNGASITVAPTTTTTYSVTGTDANGCSGTVSKTVTVLPQPPTVTTTYVTQVDNTSATCGGIVTSDGGAMVITNGICWNLAPNPTILDNYTIDGAGMDIITSCIAELMPNTTYFVRAYATNSVGTGYGNELSFATNNVAVDDYTTTYQLEVYPNPTHGKIMISVDNPNIDIAFIVIYDATGKKIKVIDWTGHNQSQEVDFSRMDAGLYSIKLFNKKGSIGQTKVIRI